jgi:hypothetical protein
MQTYIVEHAVEIAALLVGVVIFFLQLRRKALSYSITTNTSVVSVSDTVRGGIQVAYNRIEVESLRLIEIRIQNSGNQPIKPDDYVQPVAIRFSPGDVLSAELYDRHSVGAIMDVIDYEKREIVLSKTLLNPRDYFDLKFLIMDADPAISVTGRIVDVSKIQNLTRRTISNVYGSLLVLTILSFVGATVFTQAAVNTWMLARTPPDPITIAAIALFLFTGFITLIRLLFAAEFGR